MTVAMTEPQVVTLQLMTLNGVTYPLRAPVPPGFSADDAYVGFLKTVKADGWVITSTFMVPWHAISSIMRVGPEQAPLAMAQPMGRG